MRKHLSWRSQQQDRLQAILQWLRFLHCNWKNDKHEKLILAGELLCNTCDECEGNNERDYGDGIHLPLLPLETEALQLELMVGFSLLTFTTIRNIGFF